MRVLQLGPYPPPHGGVQTNLVAIRQFLKTRGDWSGVINLTRHRKPAADDVYYPRNAFETLWLLLTLRYDITHLHIGGDLSPRLLALSLVCCSIPGTKAVLTFHSGGYPASRAGRTAHPRTLRGFILRRFDAIIAVNREIAAMLQRFGVAGGRIHTICPFAAPALDSAALPDPLQRFFQSHSPVFLTVGLLEPEYDLPLQIGLMGRIRETYPGAGLVIAGSGNLEDALRRHIAGTPYSAHVMLYGDMPHPVTLRAMAECDVLLRTTLYDGDSVAVREALALGTHVIATDNGMRPAGVYLIPPRDPVALTEAIRACLAIPKNPTQTVGSKADNHSEEVYCVYRDLLPSSQSVAHTERRVETCCK
jgi:glycogen(starch) synthase